MILQAFVISCLRCTYMIVGANSEKYMSQNNFLNVLKLAGYVIPSIMTMKNFKLHSSASAYAMCRDQKLVNMLVGTQCLTLIMKMA